MSVRAAKFVLIASSLLMGSACVTFDATAETFLEDDGCTAITLSREGLSDFRYRAMCDEKYREGMLVFGDSSVGHTSQSGGAPPADAGIEGPGEVMVGNGDVTGLCSASEVEAALEQALPRIEACYDMEIGLRPAMTGTIPFDWSVGADGTVEVVRTEDAYYLGNCTQTVLSETVWPKPERGTCRASWLIGYHQGEPPTELGPGRPPTSESCDNPLAPVPGEKSLMPRELLKELDGEWSLTSLELWSSTGLGGDRVTVHTLADQFVDPPKHDPGPAEGRMTLMCHTQPLTYTVTTSTDEHGKKTETSKLAPDDSKVGRGNTTFPLLISMDDDRVQTLRRFEYELLNTRFVPKLSNAVQPEGSAFSAMFDELDGQGVDVGITKRSATEIGIDLHLKTPQIELFSRGVYQRRSP